MNFFQFLNYVIFNKDGQRQVVWNEFKRHFADLQIERWAYLNERLST
jgi:hypothetical protein